MQRQITRGASAGAGIIFHVFAQDSASTTGAGKASVAFGSWSCRYIRNGEAISGAITPEDITTIGTYAAPTANTNIRIKAVDNTNMIGIYEIQIHADWVNTTNSCQSLTIYLTATGVAVLPLQIPLAAFNLQDAVRGGLTALPNANADAAGGLPISDAGGLDMDAKLANTHEITAARMGALTDWINGGRLDLILDDILLDTGTTLDGRIPAALVGGRMDSSVGAMAANVFTEAAMAADARTRIQTESQEALQAYHLDHLIESADPGSIVANDSLLAKLVSKSATAAFADYVNTTDSLQALRDRGDAAWITATGFSTHSAADVWAVATRVLTAGTNLNNLSAAEVLTQVNAALDAAIAELGVAAPSATPSVRTALMLQYMALRNKTTSTATQTTISNNAGTTITTAAQSDDGTVYEKAEFA